MRSVNFIVCLMMDTILTRNIFQSKEKQKYLVLVLYPNVKVGLLHLKNVHELHFQDLDKHEKKCHKTKRQRMQYKLDRCVELNLLRKMAPHGVHKRL
eukprot:UN09707